MKITPAMICDICLFVLLLLVVFRYMHRGFLSDIVNLLGSVVSIAGDMFVSHTYSEPIFDQLLRPGLEKSVMKNIAENGLDVAALAEKYGGFLPESFLQNVIRSVSSALDQTAADAAQRVVEAVLKPIFVPLISIVLFFVVFMLARFLVSLLADLFTHANSIPLAGGVNRGLGAVLGVAAGCVDLFLVYCAAWSLMLLTGGALPVLNQELFDTSLVLRLGGLLNPFV